MSDLAEDVECLISTLSRVNLDQDSTYKILDQHLNCFSAELCPICEYLEEESLGDILGLLARNTGISMNVQKRILDESFKWQGAEIGVMLSLARNPALESEVRTMLLHTEIWYGFGYGHDLISDFIEAAAGNPNFPEIEIEKFKDECSESYDYPNRI